MAEAAETATTTTRSRKPGRQVVLNIIPVMCKQPVGTDAFSGKAAEL